LSRAGLCVSMVEQGDEGGVVEGGLLIEEVRERETTRDRPRDRSAGLSSPSPATRVSRSSRVKVSGRHPRAVRPA